MARRRYWDQFEADLEQYLREGGDDDDSDDDSDDDDKTDEELAEDEVRGYIAYTYSLTDAGRAALATQPAPSEDNDIPF